MEERVGFHNDAPEQRPIGAVQPGQVHRTLRQRRHPNTMATIVAHHCNGM